MKKIIIKPNKKYTLSDILLVSQNKAQIVLSKETIEIVNQCFEILNQNNLNRKIYGYNTGVADLCKQNTSNLNLFQKNLLLSHSCGVGENLEKNIVKAIIFSRLLELSKGFSGVSSQLLMFLSDILNNDITPIVSSLGSIGSSDLTILAQTFAIIFNQGKVIYNSKTYSPFEAFNKASITFPKKLKTREGLALINGNSGTIGFCGILLRKINDHIRKSLIVSAMGLEARQSTFSALNLLNQEVKPFWGNIKTVKILQKLLQDSQLIGKYYDNQNLNLLQDPLSFRCIPQIFGNAFEILRQAENIYRIELNSVTDNPLLFFIKDNKFQTASSGNFFCSQLASVLDQLSITITNLSQASCQRMQILTNQKYSEGLPEYLIENSGLNSGFMIPVYSAFSVLSEMKSLCFPRSIMSSNVANGWENISTNAFNTVLNLNKILNLANEILPLEYLFAIQSLALRKKMNPNIKLGKETTKVYEKIIEILKEKSIVFPIEKDQYLKEIIGEFKNINNHVKIS